MNKHKKVPKPAEYVRPSQRTWPARPWTGADVVELRKLAESGLSATQAAQRVQRSRCACIGKANRSGIVFKGTGARPKRWFVEGAKLNTVTETVRPKIEPLHRNVAQSVYDLGDSQCRWPIGDTTSKDFHFCANARFPGKSYCVHHLKNSMAPYQKGNSTNGKASPTPQAPRPPVRQEPVRPVQKGTDPVFLGVLPVVR